MMSIEDQHDVSGHTPKTPPSASVVIPTLNRPEEVDAAVASVLAQDVPCEIIVVDDGSMPPVSKVGSLDNPLVTVVRNEEPMGPTRARNRGLATASSPYIAFLDDDDRWLPGKMVRCLKIAEEFPHVKVVVHRTGFDERMATGRPGAVTIESEPLHRYGRRATPHLDSLLVDADLAKSVGFDENFYACQDVDFVLELARNTSFAISDEVLALRGQDTPPSAIGIERRIAGRQLLKTKHADVFDSDPEAKAFHCVRVAHLHRRGGNRSAAIRSFLEALGHRPWYSPAWRGLLTTMLPQSVARRVSIATRIRTAKRSRVT